MADLAGCAARPLLIDAGANLGEGVDAWFKGALHSCALHSPNRLYGARWQTAGKQERASMMQPLARPRDWCVRSFEANSVLLPALRQKEAAERAAGLEVRYVDGLFGTFTSDSLPRRITTFSSHPAGSMSTRFGFREIHAAPPPLHDQTVRGASFDVRQLVAEALRLHPSREVALRLDIEGEEFFVLEALTTGDELLCNVSFLFVEYHNLHANLSSHGLPANLSARDPHMTHYLQLGARIRSLMDRPGCRLRIHWRNFWSACGDPARYVWMKSSQATGNMNASRTESKGKTRNSGRRHGRARRG